MTLKAVVFDVGNVLYRWHPRFLFEKLIPDADERAWFLGNVVTLEWHIQHDAGRPIAEMIAERCERFPDHAALIRAYAERWLETIPGPVPGVHKIVEELSGRGVPLYAITNFGVDFWALFRPTAPLLDRFDDILLSGKVKTIKPDPEIYRLALGRFGLKHCEALFIDDSEANVRGAEAEGLLGHHFTDADSLRAELESAGLL